MTEKSTEEWGKGKGRVIWKKGILAKGNFNLRGDAEWERSCYVDITDIHVGPCKGEGEKGEKLERI